MYFERSRSSVDLENDIVASLSMSKPKAKDDSHGKKDENAEPDQDGQVLSLRGKGLTDLTFLEKFLRENKD